MNCSSQENFLNPTLDAGSFSTVYSDQPSSALTLTHPAIHASESGNLIPCEANPPLIDSVGDEDKSSDSDGVEPPNQIQWPAFTRDIPILKAKANQDSVFNTTMETREFAMDGELQDQQEVRFANETLMGDSPTEFTKPFANKRQESTAPASASTDVTSGEFSKQVSSEEEPTQRHGEISQKIFKKRRIDKSKEIYISTESTQEDESASDQVNLEEIPSKRKPRDQSDYKFVYHPLWKYAFDILKDLMSPSCMQLCLFALAFEDESNEFSELIAQLPYAAQEIQKIRANCLKSIYDSEFDLFNPEGLGSLLKAFAKLKKVFKIDVSIFDDLKQKYINSLGAEHINIDMFVNLFFSLQLQKI